MRRLAFALFAALGLLGAVHGVPTAASAERVLSWDTEIFLEAEDSFGVVERIRWDFEGASRHGILRDIPVAYGRARGADTPLRPGQC